MARQTTIMDHQLAAMDIQSIEMIAQRNEMVEQTKIAQGQLDLRLEFVAPKAINSILCQ